MFALSPLYTSSSFPQGSGPLLLGLPAMEQSRPSPSSADHLCVLVHGLWGNPSHLGHLEKALKGRFGDKLHILAAKTNAGTFTYDGIELGGERVTREIEEHIEELKRAGQDIRKISIVG